MKVNEIFESINGEVCHCHQGSLCTFIRLAGCNLKCSYCDTSYAQTTKKSKKMSIDEIVDTVMELGNINVTITGGEPLLQKEKVIELSERLWDLDRQISIETNGTFEMESYPFINWVADWKGPSSGMRKKMNAGNYTELGDKDIIKFVIADKEDFKDALSLISPGWIFSKFAFSPVFGKIEPKTLIEWMRKESLLKENGAIFSYQLHKFIDVK